MKKFGVVAIAGLLMASSAASFAVSLNPQGFGQFLVYPYYSVNGGNSTLLSIVNVTANGKALKVRFREGYDGRSVLDFNVYLAPNATWTGQVVDRFGHADALASLITHESACTVPAFAPLAGAGNTRFLDFTDANYAGSNTFSGPTGNADGGPTGLDRTREGHFDVIEMGEVTNASHNTLDAITSSNGTPTNCAQIVSAWSAGGYWAGDSSADLAPPRGGIYGSEAVVDVEQGTIYTVNAAAIDDFSATIQHSSPGASAPDFDTASRSAGTVSATVMVGGKPIALGYTNPVDAISALFMTDSLYNEFDNSANLGALSDWVVTAPTKRFYVDPAIVGPRQAPPFAKAPFQSGFLQNYTLIEVTSSNGVSRYAGSFPYACDTVQAITYGRDGTAFPVGHPDPGGNAAFESSQALRPCLETSVLSFSVDLNGGFGGELMSALHSRLTNETDGGGFLGIIVDDIASIPFSEGRLRLDLVHDGLGNIVTTHQLAAATNGVVLIGLPVMGFLVEKFVYGNVTPGVLANYSGAYAHRTRTSCSDSMGQGACP